MAIYEIFASGFDLFIKPPVSLIYYVPPFIDSFYSSGPLPLSFFGPVFALVYMLRTTKLKILKCRLL